MRLSKSQCFPLHAGRPQVEVRCSGGWLCGWGTERGQSLRRWTPLAATADLSRGMAGLPSWRPSLLTLGNLVREPDSQGCSWLGIQTDRRTECTLPILASDFVMSSRLEFIVCLNGLVIPMLNIQRDRLNGAYIASNFFPLTMVTVVYIT